MVYEVAAEEVERGKPSVEAAAEEPVYVDMPPAEDLVDEPLPFEFRSASAGAGGAKKGEAGSGAVEPDSNAGRLTAKSQV
jgi:hypothetical protein